MCVFGVGLISSGLKTSQKQWVEKVEKRIAVTAGMLGDMKAVKMLGLSGVLETIISQLRVVELKTSERFRGLVVWQILVGESSKNPMTVHV